MRGWDAVQRGRAPLSELIAAYAAQAVEMTDPAVLIRINRLYRPAMDATSLYEATRCCWRLGKKRTRAKVAMAVYQGVVRGVYEIEEWHPKAEQQRRWEFTGRPAAEALQQKYLGRSVASYLKPGLQSPVVYVNCG